MIEELKKHLQSVGKTDESWLDLAKRFNILPNGTNKQRSDKVRKVFNSLKQLPTVEMKMDFTSNPNWIVDTTNSSGVVYNDEFYNRTTIKNKEWDEFRKWKESKNITTIKKVNGIHIILPDIHVPYHNKELLIKLASFIQDNKHQKLL